MGKTRTDRKMFLGGLLTKGIKAGYKELRKSGARSSREIILYSTVDFVAPAILAIIYLYSLVLPGLATTSTSTATVLKPALSSSA